jgi:hypothetical protein
MPSTPRTRLRRLAAGGAAFALTSALATAFAAPAGAQAPSATVNCTTSDSSRFLSGRVDDFPPVETFGLFVLLQYSDGSKSVFQGLQLFTDTTGSDVAPTIGVDNLPINLGTAVFRDLNHNGRWDPDVDDTVYRGSTTITTCPASIVLSPK